MTDRPITKLPRTIHGGPPKFDPNLRWYRRDPAPSWVPRLCQFLAALMVGGVIGYGLGIMR
jgi:hypothetical protein